LKFFGVFRESDDLREQAREKHMAGDTVEAIKLLTEAIQKDPSNVRVALDMVQVFLDIGELEQAESLFNRLPEAHREGETGRSLAGQLSFRKLATQTEGKDVLQSRVAANEDDFDARFDLAVCLVAEHDYRQAMDNLFAIIEQDRDYKEGAARELIIALTNVLAPNEPTLAKEFRRRLGTTLA
jgi:putative thioredoxin